MRLRPVVVARERSGNEAARDGVATRLLLERGVAMRLREGMEWRRGCGPSSLLERGVGNEAAARYGVATRLRPVVVAFSEMIRTVATLSDAKELLLRERSGNIRLRPVIVTRERVPLFWVGLVVRFAEVRRTCGTKPGAQVAPQTQMIGDHYPAQRETRPPRWLIGSLVPRWRVPVPRAFDRISTRLSSACTREREWQRGCGPSSSLEGPTCKFFGFEFAGDRLRDCVTRDAKGN